MKEKERAQDRETGVQRQSRSTDHKQKKDQTRAGPEPAPAPEPERAIGEATFGQHNGARAHRSSLASTPHTSPRHTPRQHHPSHRTRHAKAARLTSSLVFHAHTAPLPSAPPPSRPLPLLPLSFPSSFLFRRPRLSTLPGGETTPRRSAWPVNACHL